MAGKSVKNPSMPSAKIASDLAAQVAVRRGRFPDLEVIGKKFVLGPERPDVNARDPAHAPRPQTSAVTSDLAMPMQFAYCAMSRNVADLMLEELHQR